MIKTLVFIVSIFSFAVLPTAQSKYYKKQDADYVNQWCSANNGKIERILADGKRVDCETESHVVEVDSVVEWESNIKQAIGYGKTSGKKAKFVAVLEDPSQQVYFERAQKKIETEQLPVTIERLENFKSKSQSLKEISGPVVKKSRTGKCHVKGCGSYARTDHYDGFGSLKECQDNGGTIPKNISLARLLACEATAIQGHGLTVTTENH